MCKRSNYRLYFNAANRLANTLFFDNYIWHKCPLAFDMAITKYSCSKHDTLSHESHFIWHFHDRIGTFHIENGTECGTIRINRAFDCSCQSIIFTHCHLHNVYVFRDSCCRRNSHLSRNGPVHRLNIAFAVRRIVFSFLSRFE